MSKVSRNMGNILSCFAEIIIGILLLINPVGFTAGIIMTLGVVLAVMGVSSVVGYFRAEPEDAAQSSGLMKGLLLVGGAFVCLFKTEWLIAAFPLITVFYGVIILITGISKLQWAVDLLRLKQKYWFVALIGAALSVLFAIIILANPFASVGFLWTFIAVSLIVEAVMDILTFIFGKK
ncbi:DUF308 domain-containing protein [uncultured Dysosmobacter sp.]|uniref:DUF308 domain-containing protein n=1 Tax=uncultured Dysosmobacter sp. TaxID=2591384 RepID=UPI002603D9BD|nr:DUF308 domain-containing protein [uncultured Dysosmobacter sp.]